MSVEWAVSQYEILPSTQDKLKEDLFSNSNLQEGSVVCTDIQTKGYGRHGRKWKEGQGNLYFSYLLRPEKDRNFCSQLSLIVGISLIEVIKSYISDGVVLKWPNDILIDNKKCAGILVEAIDIEHENYPAIIVGIGVNISNAPLEISTYLNKHVNECKNISIEQFQKQFFEFFDTNYSKWKELGFEAFKSSFIEYTYPKGSKIGVKIAENKITGEFIDIDNDGNLELLCNKTEKIRKITSGDVFLM